MQFSRPCPKKEYTVEPKIANFHIKKMTKNCLTTFFYFLVFRLVPICLPTGLIEKKH